MKKTKRAESLVSIWSRRAVSLPLYITLAAVWIAASPAWLVVGMLADIGRGQLRRRPATRAFAFFAMYLGCELVGVAAAFLIWVFTVGGLAVSKRRYVALNAALQRYWTGALFHGAVFLYSMRVQVEGLELAEHGPLLVFVRHSSTADTVLTAALVANPNRLLLRYVLKRELLWDPCLDIVGRRLPNAFVDRSATRSGGEVAAVAGLAHELDASSAVLIYPEGTRFSPAKLARAITTLRSKASGELTAIAETYRHVLPPRLGGPLALLEAAPHVDVVFVEHTGFDGAATFARFWSGALVNQTIRVRLRRYAARDIPASGRERWLFERWQEIDDWIDDNLNNGNASVVAQ